MNDLKAGGVDPNGVTILEYNIGLKRTLQSAIKMMKVLREILKKIKNESQPMTCACFKRIEPLETKDSVEDIYARRMGMVKYFKDLKMYTQKIEQWNAKGLSQKDIE